MSTDQTGFIAWLKSRTSLAFIGFAAIGLFPEVRRWRAHEGSVAIHSAAEGG